MTYNATGIIYWRASGILISGGKSLPILQPRQSSTLTLGDALTCTGINLGLATAYGNLVTANYNITCTGNIYSVNTSGTSDFNLGSSQITCNIFQFGGTGGITTINAGTSKITCSANGTTLYGYDATSFYDVEFTGAGTIEIANRTSGTVTFNKLYRTCGANHTDITTISTPVDVNTEFKIIGNSAVYRTLFYGKTYGTQSILDLTSCTIGACAYVDFRDIAFSGSPNFTTANAGGEIVGGSGDCLGNTGATFTTGVNCYWGSDTASVSDTSKWWLETGHSNHRAIGGVDIRPLPQDSALFNDASFTGNNKTITVDVPRFCTNITFSNTTRTGEALANAIVVNIYGNLTLVSANGNIGTSDYLTLCGRDNHTITNANKFTTNTRLSIDCYSGTYTLQDEIFNIFLFKVVSGGFFDGNNDITFVASASSSFTSTGTFARTITKGTGTWTFVTLSAVTFWNFTDPTNLTFTDSGTTVCNQTNATTKTIQSGGKTFNNITFNNGSSSPIVIAGSPTISGVLTIAAGIKAISLTAGTILTLGASSTIVNGSTVANPCTIASATATSAAYITRASGIVELDKLVITDIQFSTGALWYLGYETIFTRCVGHMATMQQAMVGLL